MKITILETTTKYPLQVMGQRAGVCWNADITDSAKNRQRGIDCLKSGHGRVLEYVNVEMIIDGISARLGREYYTHIAGGPTRLQASTRYINYKDFDYITPPKIANNADALEAYEDAMSTIAAALQKLESFGIPREDSAMLLPLGMTTKIVDKRNLRNLIDMSHVRLCSRAYLEYRQLMNEICKELSALSPEWKWIVDNYMQPKCEMMGYCNEKKSCGRKGQKNEG